MGCCTCGRGYSDGIGILVVGVFSDSDAITGGQECVELGDEHCMALEEIGYTFDNARCIDPLGDEGVR